jgi:NADH:ubiquinone oxidoreductase subunit F (NADH-binding)/Pyruvate/2-oxoacid:ferredoxin oxidoreductase delta subunit
MKWASCRMGAGPEKFVVCNCDDGAPGAYAGRTVIESSPHAVIEAMAIGAKAVGASSGFIYVRAEYELAVNRTETALAHARDNGLLGRDIMGTGFDFDIQAVHGESALICGESTALLASIEGRPAEPRHNQVHSSARGLWGRPTLLNNVETWANVPPIIRNGAAWFRSIGSPSCPGTKVLTPGGRIRNLGVVEVPTGTPLSTVVGGPCGGPAAGRRIKAVQACGPAGGFIPERLLGTGMEYESLEQAGAMMCTGGLIAFDDRACIVETARSSIEFLAEECCGKCTPCREGLPRMLSILESICRGRGREGDVEFLEEIAWTLKDASFCGLGKSAANPVLSSIRFFRDEYIAHMDEKRCPAGVCPDLTRFVIDPEKCSGCGLCVAACPAGAIAGAAKKAHSIRESLCVKCGACRDACRLDAVSAVGTAVIPVQKQLLR